MSAAYEAEPTQMKLRADSLRLRETVGDRRFLCVGITNLQIQDLGFGGGNGFEF